jgi:hypothetical protein
MIVKIQALKYDPSENSIEIPMVITVYDKENEILTTNIKHLDINNDPIWLDPEEVLIIEAKKVQILPNGRARITFKV